MMTKKIKMPSKFFQPNQPPTLRAHKTPPSLSLSLSLSVSEAASMAWRGNLSKSIKELRFLFCQTSPASSHTRDFVLKNYTDLKTKNPKLPILIRECSGVQPQIWARYGI
ncbi:NADH dehydrogenase [ubiquinone] 1 alpha subcomplex subunit 2 [Rhynchospora pubera]|uniref:NADH dehydrogenase [ubiquinone] 1 alpha subcomplex subunit 2 n=1 Tax=Rhynchospora pubera TaxID=906938 RepID=A0AAV8FL23_9POAL|nr:NADH dehydrogenase [ubiquinone] 1 alpha subcomplex subunit 2 [Rhynchospora pubera]